jgi:hypothetical protein
MAVTDWTTSAKKEGVESGMSSIFSKARFTVLLDEDFVLEERGLPINRAPRQIENMTQAILNQQGIDVGGARVDPTLQFKVINAYQNRGYLHVFIKP